MSAPSDPARRFLASIDPEPPPTGLRPRALARAREAWVEPATADRWRTLWESRPLRLAWAAAVLILILANLTQPPPQRRAARQPLEPEIETILALPRIDATHLIVDISASGTRLQPPADEKESRT